MLLNLNSTCMELVLQLLPIIKAITAAPAASTVRAHKPIRQ